MRLWKRSKTVDDTGLLDKEGRRMSTKIYDGYRFPRNRLDEFILLFNRICHRSVRRLLKKYRISDKTVQEARKQLQLAGKSKIDQYTDDDVCLVWQLVQWMRASKNGSNDMFHMDCSFNLWLDGKWAYMIPFVANGMRMGRLLPNWCESYGYWDNTDPQEGVSEKEWEARGENWARIATDDWDKTRLAHIVFELKMPHLNGLTSLLRSINRNEEWMDRIYTTASWLYWELERDRHAKAIKGWTDAVNKNWELRRKVDGLTESKNKALRAKNKAERRVAKLEEEVD
jgi:hypothetical protein